MQPCCPYPARTTVHLPDGGVNENARNLVRFSERRSVRNNSPRECVAEGVAERTLAVMRAHFIEEGSISPPEAVRIIEGRGSL